MSGHDREMEREFSQLADLLAHEAPRRARPGLLDDVLARTKTTSQVGPRPWWRGVAWDRPRPSRALQIALAGILVVVIGSGLALVGSRPAERGSLVGASPGPSPRLAPADAWPPLEPGVPYYFDKPVRVTFSVPSGWTYSFTNPPGSVVINEQRTAAVGWFVTSNLHADPCHWQDGTLDPPVGPSVSDLVRALKRLPGFAVTGPTPAMVGGLQAQSLTLVQTVSAADCDESQVKVWSETPTGGQDTYGGTSTVRVLDVGGTRLMVITTPLPDSADTAADIEAILGSMQFQ
jgi:hypothetical protein